MNKFGMSIDTIVFDIGNILMYDYPMESKYLEEIYQQVIKYHDMSIKQFFSNKYDDGLANNKWIYDFGKNFFKDKWEKINHEAWKSVLSSWEELCIPIQEAIKAILLHKNDYSYAICANQPRQTKEFLKRIDLLDLFDVVILDGECGISKPDIEIFYLLLKKLKKKPENVIMIGDKYENDIVPALNANINTCLLILDIQKAQIASNSEWDKFYFESYYGNPPIVNFSSGRPDIVVDSVSELFIKL